MPIPTPNHDLLHSAQTRLNTYDLYWLIGGAGSGKSTLCQALAQRGFSVVDMDAKIYGSFHGRFDPHRHPANTAWSAAENSLGFLLSLSWPEFDAFHRTAAVEYLDLLTADLDLLIADLSENGVTGPMVVDGGI